MERSRRHLRLLLLILLCGAALRFTALGQRPPGAYWDESAIVVNARLLSAAGHDQYGVRWPLFWRALDDYKAPVFPYSFVAWSRVFGDDVPAARGLAATWGLLGLAACWLLAREVLGPGRGPILATTLLAVSPWHLHYSRIAWQAITLVTLTTLAAAALLRGLRLGADRGRPWLQAAAIGLAGVLYTYSPAKLWVPLLLLALLGACARQRAWPWRPALTARLGLLFGLAALPFAVGALAQHDALTLRFRAVTLLDGPSPLRAVAASYASHFDPAFLFLRGDPVLRHSPPGIGHLLWAQALLVPVGLVHLWRRRQVAATLLVLWVALAPLLGALTPGPHATRAIAWLPALQVVGAAGALVVLRWRPAQPARARLALALALALSAGASAGATLAPPSPAVAAAWQAQAPATIASARALQAEHRLREVVFLRGTQVTYIDWLYARRPDPAEFLARRDALAQGRDRYDPLDEAGKFWFLGARFPAPDADVALGPAELLVAPEAVRPVGLELLHRAEGIAFWRTPD